MYVRRARRRTLRLWRRVLLVSPRRITERNTSPTISMPVITLLPSVAASSASRVTIPSIAATLPDPPAMGGERASHFGLVGGMDAERGRRRCPRFSVAADALGAEPRAERDQLRQLGDRLHAPRLGDPYEAVRVEVVPEQQRGLVVGRREQARRPVVAEVTLVDRLQPERVALVGERGEYRLALRVRAVGVAPKHRLRLRSVDDLVKDLSETLQRRRSCGRCPRRSARARRTSPRTATARDRSHARGGGGSAPRIARCRTSGRRRSCAPGDRTT